MKPIVVPSVEEAEAFVQACQKIGLAQFDYPVVNERWLQGVDDCLKQVEMSLHYGETFERVTAKLFCLLNMGHRLVDGNKRTSIIVTVLFLYVNGYLLDVDRKTLKEFAVKIAKRRNSMFDRAIDEVKIFISDHILPHSFTE